jgi:hypothetical protein
MFQNMTKMMCVGLSLLLAVAAGPALAVTGNSHTWEGQFDFTELPDASGVFSLFAGSSGVDPIVKAGPPTHVEFHPTGTHFYNKETPVDFDSGFTVEWRIRAEGGTLNSGQVKLTAYDTGQSEHVVTRLQYNGARPNGEININCCSGPSFPFGMHNALLPNNPYHTFRMTVLGDDVNLYVDGGLTPMAITSPAAGTDAGAPHALGGLEFGSKIMHDQWAYLRWTSAGAFAHVIPEPASLGLMGIGGLLLIRRRER